MSGRTPLTYYGGKQSLARRIVAMMPDHRLYLEPFAGGAACLFAKPRAEREALNDLDGQIMRFWRALRDRPDELAAAVAATPYGRDEWRASDGEFDSDVEAARQLLVNVDQSFSRSRRSWSPPHIGEGRGPWRPATWVKLPPILLAAAERLQGVALENRDACNLIAHWDRPDAVIYCDPPYTGDHRRRRVGGGKGGSHGYNVDDDDGRLWGRLVDTLLAVENATVLLSGYPCDEADRLGWQSVTFDRKRTVQARDGGKLTTAPETLWLSPNAGDAAPNLFTKAAA